MFKQKRVLLHMSIHTYIFYSLILQGSKLYLFLSSVLEIGEEIPSPLYNVESQSPAHS